MSPFLLAQSPHLITQPRRNLISLRQLFSQTIRLSPYQIKFSRIAKSEGIKSLNRALTNISLQAIIILRRESRTILRASQLINMRKTIINGNQLKPNSKSMIQCSVKTPTLLFRATTSTISKAIIIRCINSITNNNKAMPRWVLFINNFRINNSL